MDFGRRNGKWELVQMNCDFANTTAFANFSSSFCRVGKGGLRGSAKGKLEKVVDRVSLENSRNGA